MNSARTRGAFATPSTTAATTRRTVLASMLAILACGAGMNVAHADTWPNRAVRMIVPFPPGAAPDVVARLLADRLAQAWGQSVVVENRPGAGGIPGMVALAHSAADGYTIGLVPAAAATLTPYLYKNPQYSIDKDLIPVATVGTGPMMVVVNSNSPIDSLGALVAYSKANPGKVNFAAAQPNSVPHLTGEMLNKATNMGLFTVPYQGSQAAVTAVLAGDATVTMDGLPGLVGHVKGGKLRAIAVTSDKRLPGFESVPTVSETYPGFESIGWFGVFAPVGVSSAVVEKLNADVNKAVQTPELTGRYAELGIYPRVGTPNDLKQFVSQQTALFKKVVEDLGLQAQ
ncbi:tripartite tricarboxylate transporter substrate binding protein [soil metagenome]